jgi:hypothetical protein
MKHRILILICALLVLLFSYTAASKLMDLRGFAYDLHNQPFPRWMGNLLTWLLPAMELLIALLLLFDRTRLPGLWSALVLMGLFTIYTALILAGVFHRVPCSCGGVIKLLNWKQHLVFNLFFVGLSWWGIRIERKIKLMHA